MQWNISIGLFTMLGALLSSHLAYSVYPHDFFIIVLATCFGLFLPFFRFGSTRVTQLRYVSLYGVIAYFFLIGLSLVLSYLPIDSWYRVLAYTLLIFLSLITHRYLRGGRGVGVFLVLYLLIFISMVPSHAHFSQLVFASSVSFVIGYLSCFVCLFCLPFAAIDCLPPDRGTYLIKNAVRVCVVIDLILMLTRAYPVANLVWVTASALVVSEVDIGSSVKKSLERILGTIIGAVIGVFIAHFMFKPYPVSMYLCLPLIFASYALIAWSYTLGIALITVWLSATFYLIKPGLSLDQFIFARIVDTCLGVLFGLFGIFFLFPNSLYKTIRQDVSVLKKLIADYFTIDNPALLSVQLSKIRASLAELLAHQKIIRYEPALHLSKRYAQIKKISHIAVELVNELEVQTAQASSYRANSLWSQLVKLELF